MDYIMINGELYHHGVKGMKWGVRRAKKNSSKNRRSSKKRARNSNSIKEKGKKFVDVMSTKEARRTVRAVATIASGSLWVVSALVPGAPTLNAIAAAANLTAVIVGDEE